MAREIEKKYLVKSVPFELSGLKVHHIKQGYLSIEPGGNEVRLRQKDEQYFITVKSTGGLIRNEYEIELSAKQFDALWPATQQLRLSKRRYLLQHQGRTIELDVYEEELSGLIVAEIEFSDEDQANAFTALPWFDKEVTNDPEFRNQQLAKLKPSP